MTEYAQLKDRYDDLVRQRERAQAKNEQAEEQLKNLITEIRDGFDVESIEEAKELLTKLSQQRDELVLKITAELDKVDG